ncbi:MAG: PBP1A family penicillin-binding protein [Candidatus Pacebacteria bacterium]|nr:PBP1A family penicillin-binding protein [Candidatus Paceibacterota bacterium]
MAHPIRFPSSRHLSLRKNSIFKNIFLALFGLGFFAVGGVLIWLMTIDIPSIAGFHDRKVAESTKIYDRTGEILLYDVHGTVRRTKVPFADISRYVKNATIAIEDAEFYTHLGIKPTSILRAVLANIQTGRFSQGGSTITQQVVKNTLLTSDKTITRKIKEWILALRIEQILTKEEIFEIYLNESPYGGTIYGVEEAARYFFGKSSKDVSLAEAAYLAALPQAPTYYSPFGNHRDALESRKNLVLLKMKEHGFISDEEYSVALVEKVTFTASDDGGIKAPHFVFYVREYLEEKYGVNAVNEEGLEVITTLDFDLQRQAEDIVRKHALDNAKTFNAENASLVAVDPKTGQILAMVGSRGYFDDGVDGKYNIALAQRQPGSSFKPFVYATAFAKGYTPETVVFDVATQFNSSCPVDDLTTHDECYAPQNYDAVFRGPMTLRNALAQSVNVPAVKILYLAGVKESLDTAKRLGITTLTRPLGYYGLPLVLGGGEVTLLEMVGAYGVFANDGVRNPSTAILSVKDASGEEVEKFEEKSVQAIDAEVARTMNDVLSDNNARIPAFGERSALVVPGYSVAVKTGTTNDYRDVWILGYTPHIAVGAWAGNNDNRAMEKKVAGFIIAPLWNEFMQYALPKFENTPFTPPTEVDTTQGNPILHGVWSQPGEGIHSILHFIDKENPLGPKPTNPQKDSQYYAWEYSAQVWAGTIQPSSTPTIITPSQIVPTVAQNPFVITSPQNGTHHTGGTLLTIEVLNNPLNPLKKVAYYLNGVFIGGSDRTPFSISVVPSVKGPLRIQAVAESVQGVLQTSTSIIVD